MTLIDQQDIVKQGKKSLKEAIQAYENEMNELALNEVPICGASTNRGQLGDRDESVIHQVGNTQVPEKTKKKS